MTPPGFPLYTDHGCRGEVVVLLSSSDSISRYTYANIALSLRLKTLRFARLVENKQYDFCVYHPPPSTRNKLTKNDFFDEFAKFSSGDNILVENVLLVRDFNFQMD